MVNRRRRHARWRARIARVQPLIGHKKRQFAAIVIASALSGVLEAGLMAVVANVATAMSAGETRSHIDLGPVNRYVPIAPLFVAAMGMVVLRLVLQLVIAYLPARLSAATQTRLRVDLFEAYSAAAWSEKAADREGRLQELVGAQAVQAALAVMNMANFVSAALTFIALLASALVLSVPVATGILVVSAGLFSALRPLSRRVRRMAASTADAGVNQAGEVAEAVRLAQELETFGVWPAARARVTRAAALVGDRTASTRELSRVGPVLYQTFVMTLLVGGLALLYGLGTKDLASLGAVVLILVRAGSYGQQMQTAYQLLGESSAYVSRVESAIDQYRSSAPPNRHIGVGPIRALEFREVSFAYTPTVPVLREISFTIQAGELVGIVGPSGAGKSTLVQLLLGIRDPVTGQYLANGVDVREIDRQEWSRRVAYVPQDTQVLAGTVADNIRFFRPDISDDAIVRGAKQAQLDADIRSWTLGYDTLIGDRADALSGGQRQRLCIARALAGEPDVVLLDEPTSALDLHSERQVQQALEALHGCVTVIVVAHRISTIAACDRVMVLRDGRVEAFEPPATLSQTNAFFHRSVQLAQAGPNG